MSNGVKAGDMAELLEVYNEVEQLKIENDNFRSLLRMVLANLRNPILGGISKEQILAIDEALGYPFD